MLTERLYSKMTRVTLVSLYLLIFVGSLVRSTGSGLGCPDWPKCFGTYVPPTHVSQLPADYKTRFKIDQREIADFDATKTWIEYLNRLLGVMVGFFVFFSFLSSLVYRKTYPGITFTAFSVFILTGAQGFLGAKVVSSHLNPIIITAHLLLALLIVLLVHYQDHFATKSRTITQVTTEDQKYFLKWTYLCLFILFVQILLGIQVRETVDAITGSLTPLPRKDWVENLGLTFYLHRSFSILVLLVTLYFSFKVVKSGYLVIKTQAIFLFLSVLGLCLSGIILSYFSFPKLVQPIHLTLASFGLSQAYLIWLKLRN